MRRLLFLYACDSLHTLTHTLYTLSITFYLSGCATPATRPPPPLLLLHDSSCSQLRSASAFDSGSLFVDICRQMNTLVRRLFTGNRNAHCFRWTRVRPPRVSRRSSRRLRLTHPFTHSLALKQPERSISCSLSRSLSLSTSRPLSRYPVHVISLPLDNEPGLKAQRKRFKAHLIPLYCDKVCCAFTASLA